MAIYLWSELLDGAELAFDVLEDLLEFDDALISASAVAFDSSIAGEFSFSHGGKTVALLTGSGSIATGNLTFADGSKLVIGSDGNDTLFGSAGGDRIVGQAGDDSLSGLSGNDVLVGGPGNDTLTGSFGNDTVDYSAASEAVAMTFAGGLVVASGGPSVGTDTFFLVDVVIGSAFDDTMSGAAPYLRGGAGNDVLTGGIGSDTLEGGAGDDRLSGGDGSDTASYRLDGALGSGIVVNFAAGTVTGDPLLTGTDVLRSIEAVEGTDAADVFDATGYSRSSANAGPRSGANVFQGLGGDDLVIGNGKTHLLYSRAQEAIGADLSSGTIAGGASVGSDSVSGVSAVTGSPFGDGMFAGAASAELDGAAGDDTLFGAAGNDVLRGGAGDDAISGGAGNDVLVGDAGGDTLAGGAGDDRYSILDGDDVLIENPGEGRDSVMAGVSTVLPANFEDLELFAFGIDMDLTGNDLPNNMTGNAMKNVFDGRGGADTMAGREDSDTYFVDEDDVVIELPEDEGVDRVVGLGSILVLPENVEAARLAARAGPAIVVGSAAGEHLAGNGGANRLDGGAGDDTLEGGRGDDTLLGGDGNDTLDGGRGADVMDGGAGDDVYVAGSARDRIVELAGGGRDTVLISSARYDLAANLEDAVVLYGGGARVSGNSLANVLTGGGGADCLDGGAGNDVFVYGGGDSIDGGAGVDTLKLALAGLELDLRDGHAIASVERLQLRDGGANEVRLDAAGVARLNEAAVLRIDGDASGMLHMGGGWVRGADVQLDGRTYARYTQDGATVLAQSGLAIDDSSAVFMNLAGLISDESGPTPGFTFLSPGGERADVTYDPHYDRFGGGTDDMQLVEFDSNGTAVVYRLDGGVDHLQDMTEFAGYVSDYYIGFGPGTPPEYLEDIRNGKYWLGEEGVLYEAWSFQPDYLLAIN